jgi:hypothetical protein
MRAIRLLGAVTAVTVVTVVTFVAGCGVLTGGGYVAEPEGGGGPDATADGADAAGGDAAAGDDGAAGDASGDAAGQDAEAGAPTLHPVVFASLTDAAGATELAVQGEYVYWAWPAHGVYRRSVLSGAPPANWENLNASGVVVDSLAAHVAVVPNGAGFNNCEARTLSPLTTPTASSTDFSESCPDGAQMTLALLGTTLYMVGPGAELRSFDLNAGGNAPAQTTVTQIGYAEGDETNLYFTDPGSTGKGRIMRTVPAQAPNSFEVLSSDWALYGIAVTDTYFYLTATKASGERAILRATKAGSPAVDRVFSRGAGADLRDIVVVPTSTPQLYWIENGQILTAPDPG